MEDPKLLLYLVLGGIYVVSKLLKKKKSATPASDDFEQETAPSQGPSFEELMKEITGKKEEEIIQERTRTHVPETNEVREPYFTPEVEEIQPVTGETSEMQEELEEIKSLERQYEVIREKPKYERSEEYKLDKGDEGDVAGDIMALLSDVHGAKKIIIAKEILDRKY